MNFQILKFVISLAEEERTRSSHHSENFKQAMLEFLVAAKNLIKFF